MTEAEKNEIVGLVMTEISSQAVDFDIATEQPQANDLLTAVREVAGRYVGVTLKWNDVARIATELANQAAKRAEQAETDANNILTQVQSKGTEITNFVATSKAEIETQKDESVNAVKSVYQTDLDELKGDLTEISNTIWGEATKELYSGLHAQDSNYFIVDNLKKFVKGETYYIEFDSNETFSIDNVQIGTASQASAMVDTIGTLSFVANEKKTIRYTPSTDGCCYIRFIENTAKIKSVNAFTVSKEKIDEPIIQKLKKVDNISSSIDNKMSISSDGKWKKMDSNYWIYEEGRYSTTELGVGKKYKITFLPNTDFVCDLIQIGTDTRSSAMVDTLATNITFENGKDVTIEYIVKSNGIKAIRLYGVASNFDSIDVSEEKETNILKGSDVLNISSVVDRVNKTAKEIKVIKNTFANVAKTMLRAKISEGTTRTITVPVRIKNGKQYARIGLHYGASKFTPMQNDVFFNKECRTDFSDVRFKINGVIVNAELGTLVNGELLCDNRINDVKKVTNSGKLIAFRNNIGISVSDDNGNTFSVIEGTYNVTSNRSDVENFTSMCPVFVDDNDDIYAYAGGILYKLIASDGYSTKRQVLDFSWTHNGNKIYPDIQIHAMDKDINGNLYVGIYQGTQYFKADIYVSTDGGESFVLKLHDANPDYQHIHHIHADKYSNKVYVGVDGVGNHTLMTDDGGNTWNEIADKFVGPGKTDYYPTYFGDGFRLGGGETYISGNATIYRSEDDIHIEKPVLGYAGVRSYAGLTDDFIVTGTQTCTGVAENHILISTDKGKSWESVFTKYQEPMNASGLCYRNVLGFANLIGDDNGSCALLISGEELSPNFRMYVGGDDWYREAWVELHDIQTDSVDVEVETGYLMEYPFSNLREENTNGLVYHVPFAEGFGNIITDSTGKSARINGISFEWDTSTDIVRYGDEIGKSTKFRFAPSFGIRMNKGNVLNFGKVTSLDFSMNYTISVWVNTDSIDVKETNSYNLTGQNRMMFKVGNMVCASCSNNILLLDASNEIDSLTNWNDIPFIGMRMKSAMWKYSDQYNLITITVGNDGVCKVYINGCLAESQRTNGQFLLKKLSDFDIEFGSDSVINPFFISDFKIYNRCFTDDEVMDMYRGF